MATGGEEQVGYSLANVRTLTLENNTDESPYYISIVISQDKIIVVDYKDKVKIHRLQNGKFLDMVDSESPPRYICLMDDTTICVLHYDGLIEIASIKSEDKSPVFTRRRLLHLHGVLLDRYHCAVSVSDNIVVVGEKQGTIYWCIVSLDDGHVKTIHIICKGSKWSDVKAKDTMIYVLCCAGVKSPNTGVYGFDIVTPSQCKYKYKHQRLQKPTSIVINGDGNIFVGNFGVHVGNGVLQDFCIHQLTASCQLVAIFTQGIPRYITAMFWDHGRMYVTCDRSRDITVFRHVYQGSHKASDVLVSVERKLPGIKEAAIQISQGNVDNGQLSIETKRPPSGSSPENNEDEKHGNHKDSEIPISDQERQVIEWTSTQIGQEIVDNVQLIVETERTPSESSPENNEDEKHGSHKDSEIPISDEERQQVIEWTYTQLGQEIVRPYIAQTDCDSNAVPAIPQHPDSEIGLSESAVVSFFYPEETLAAGSPSHIVLPDLKEIPPQTADQEQLFPFPPKRPERMIPLEPWNRPIPPEPVKQPVGRLYENLHSHPRFIFAGTSSSYHTGIAANLLRPMRDTGTMTDAAPSRQTVDTAVQCDITQFRL